MRNGSNEKGKEGNAEFWNFICAPEESGIFDTFILSKNGYVAVVFIDKELRAQEI